jgi:hypothetical protein
MNADGSPAGLTPDTDVEGSENRSSEQEPTNAEMRNIIERMHERQQQMEAELTRVRADYNSAEAPRRAAASGGVSVPQEEPSMAYFMRSLLETLAQGNGRDNGREVTGPRDWRPPTWNGSAETFRDYLMRIKSSFRVRSLSKPSLSAPYYWDAIYDTLPARQRSRMRHFWAAGDPVKGKDPEAFFTQLEHVFADSNEMSKALERLHKLEHKVGQPWHEHQLEFDGLLLSAGGDIWANNAKIGALKSTFSNPAKLYTASLPNMVEYHRFAEEVERVMTNLETTDQFRAANKRWAREEGKEAATTTTVTTHGHGTVTVDGDGDTVMAPARTGGSRSKSRGNRKESGGVGGKQRAKWVDTSERERRREKKLCFRCGAGGHQIKECPYASAVQPTAINSTSAKPMLENDATASEPDSGND